MITVPNFLSFLRLPLALLFLCNHAVARTVILLLAAATDFFDGYLARQQKQVTRIGTVLDPITDKIFVMTALCLFVAEGKIAIPEVGAMLCRDFSIILFGGYLLAKGEFGQYQFRSIWCGKITTTLQLLTLLALTLDIAVPSPLYLAFVLLGATALVELYLSNQRVAPPTH